MQAVPFAQHRQAMDRGGVGERARSGLGAVRDQRRIDQWGEGMGPPRRTRQVVNRELHGHRRRHRRGTQVDAVAQDRPGGPSGRIICPYRT